MLGLGQMLGNYRIVRRLGSGGMGVVYEAEHPLIGKRVALKVIHKELAANHEVVTRFFNEARAVNQIGHDHVVDVADFGQTASGEYFLVMEMLVGESLADVLERAPGRKLTVPRALHVAAQIADGLGAAHAAGVIHRDLKPDNVFLVAKLGERDFVKIVDFGLAKLIAEAGAGGGITKQGVILGTPEYMSPEQAESRKTIDHRADVWALGILLYQMLTGLLPFVGASMGEVLVKVVSRGAAPPRSVNPEIPPAVEQIVLRCLQKRPEDRFAGMAELRDALMDPDKWWATQSAGRPSGPVPAVAVTTGPLAPTLAAAAAPKLPVASPAARTLIGAGVPEGGEGARPVAVAPAAAAAPAAATATAKTVMPAALPTIMSTMAPTAVPPPTQVQVSALPGLKSPQPAVSATRVLPPEVAAGAAGRTRGRRLWIGMAVGVLIAGGPVGAWLAMKGTGAASAPATRTGTAAAAGSVDGGGSDAAAAIAVARPPDASVDFVRIAISTEPTGAEIFDDATGEKLGTSPAELQLPRGSGERVLRFFHPGFGEKEKTVRTSSDAELEIVLEPMRRPHGGLPAPDAAAGKLQRPDKDKKKDPDLIAPPF